MWENVKVYRVQYFTYSLYDQKSVNSNCSHAILQTWSLISQMLGVIGQVTCYVLYLTFNCMEWWAIFCCSNRYCSNFYCYRINDWGKKVLICIFFFMHYYKMKSRIVRLIFMTESKEICLTFFKCLMNYEFVALLFIYFFPPQKKANIHLMSLNCDAMSSQKWRYI